MRELVLFDFDGTLTRKDSLIEFLKFYNGKWYFYLLFALSLPMIIHYIYIKKEGWKAKEKLIARFLKGKSREEILGKGKAFGENVIPKLLIPSAMAKLKWHQKLHHRVLIVSASLDVWLSHWANQNNVDLVCTKLSFDENGITNGLFATINCNGEEKVNRIKECVNIDEYEVIHAYGNSKGDLPMLDLAHHRYYKHFN